MKRWKQQKRKQKRLAKKQFGSKNYLKLKKEIAKLYKKIKNARKYTIHHITKEIIENNDIIVCETLKVKNMVKNHHLAKSIMDASLSEIIRQLEYKTKWKGKKLYKIDQYYPSSQTCSHCGYKNPSLKDLSIRKYSCPNCNYELDRDVNAAINICFEGLKIYMNEVYAQNKNQKFILNIITIRQRLSELKTVEHVGNDGYEPVNLRCEPKIFKIYFEFCS